MKILLVNKFHYYKGGSETYYFALDELLKTYGHTIIHFAMQDEKNLDSETKDYFVRKVDFNSHNILNKMNIVKNMFYSQEAYRKMKELLQKEEPDIVHIGLVHKQITYSILDAIKEYNIPVVQSVHDLIFVCPCYTMLTKGENCQACLNGSILNCIRKKCVKDSSAKSILAVLENRYILMKGFYNHIDLFITECKFYKDILEKSGFAPSKIENITNFLPPSKKIELIHDRGDYFLFFGRFSIEKGIMTLLEAYRKSKLSTPLILVGGGPIQNDIKIYMRTYHLEKKVILAGYVYGEKMNQILQKAKAVIVPSEWYENCPYSIMEAMGKSRIVIASNIGGLPDLIKDNVTGYLFEPRNSDELATKLNKVDSLTEKEYKEMGQAIYEFSKKVFSPESYYHKILAIYTKLINGRR